MNNKNDLIIGVVVGLIIGGCASYFFVNSSYEGNTYADGWSAAKTRLLETTPLYKMLEDQEIKSVTGTVKNVSGNSVTIKINAIEPLTDPSLDTREVNVDSNTKILIAVRKTPEDFQKGMIAYQKTIESIAKTGKGEMPSSPEEFNKSEGKISDITKDSTITVLTDKDMKRSKTFTALEISVQKN